MTKEEAWKQYCESDSSLFGGGIGENDLSKIQQIFYDGYHECQKEHKGKCKTAYIKGIRTMANALKDYDRTDGAWTDYFEHTVDEVLKRLLKESE